MHDGQLEVDAGLARELVSRDFPVLTGLAVDAVGGAGTVNRTFRVGPRAAARFPLLPTAAADLEKENAALSAFAAASPFPAPRPVGVGAPHARYPSAWTVQTWVPGAVADPSSGAAEPGFADDLARLIAALRRVSTGGRAFDGQGRGGLLADHDEWMDHCITQSMGLVWYYPETNPPVAELGRSTVDRLLHDAELWALASGTRAG